MVEDDIDLQGASADSGDGRLGGWEGEKLLQLKGLHFMRLSTNAGLLFLGLSSRLSPRDSHCDTGNATS